MVVFSSLQQKTIEGNKNKCISSWSNQAWPTVYRRQISVATLDIVKKVLIVTKNNKRNSIIDNANVEINKTGESCRNSKKNKTKKNDSLLMDTVINNI